MGSGHNLHPIAVGICVLGGDSRRLFPESGGLGARQDVGGAFSTGSAQQSSGREETRARLGAPFRSRAAVRVQRVCKRAQGAPDDPEHESAGESVRQCEFARAS